MTYERGRAHLEIGRHLPPSPQRREHLSHALELLERCGAVPDLERVRAALTGARPAAPTPPPHLRVVQPA